MSKPTGHRPPDGRIRRSMAMVSAGPGAVVDLVDHAVMIRGLDQWRYSGDDEGFIQEPRLEAQALRMLHGAGHYRHPNVRLRLPPRCDNDKAAPWVGVGARPFPGWYHCRRCHGLVGKNGLTDDGRHICTDGDTRHPASVVPIRFVAGCPSGHLQDIYWRWWVHKGERTHDDEESPYLCTIDEEKGEPYSEQGHRYTGDLVMATLGTTGELSDMIVRCRRCGERRSLQDLRTPRSLGTCRGWRPWLTTNDDTCEHDNRLMIRTGSNVWFPQRLSVLSIPQEGLGLRAAVSKHWEWLKKVNTRSELNMILSLQEVLERAFRPEGEGYDDDEILAAIHAKRNNLAPAASIRELEWSALHSAKYEVGDDLPERGQQWFARRREIPPHPTIERVVLVHALREVRALVGFTRLEGVTITPEGDLELDGQTSAPLAERADWIPAVEVLGEGVFIALHENVVRAWESRPAVQQREEQFRKGLRKENEALGKDVDRFTGARLIMLHSLAHLLITQISLECGYSASAIRERIYCYCDPDDPEKSRAGILLFTGTPGSEGTLGGLVEVGKEITRHLDEALHRAKICSNDPVCAQHEPDGAEDGRRREGAACHGCLLIAESSCERQNRDLDRGLVVGVIGGVEGVGFFEGG